tara:strand:+ start:96 stop:317 length:222 start_codon:yes stop_codon:yes gene_type:complete
MIEAGDYVEKVEGFGSEMKNLAGKTGLVVSLVTYSVEGVAQSDFTHLREPKLIVLTGEGELEMWIKKFCAVVF